MIRKPKFYRRWKRRFLAGLKSIENLLAECLRTGDPEAVHDLRVTLRRTRLLARVGTPVLGKARAREFRQWALQPSVILGPVRDHDVTLAWLNTHSPASNRNRILQAQRAREWRATRPKLAIFSKARWKQLRRWKAAAVKPGKLRKGFFQECARTRGDLRHDAARFHSLDSAGRHEFRRTLRRLRYLRELALSRREQKSDLGLKQLIAFQEALGEAQNCAVVRAFVSSHTRTKWGQAATKLAHVHEQKWMKSAARHLRTFLRRADKP